jgi:hypothetical protein
MESMVPEERVTPLRMGLMIQVFPPVLHRETMHLKAFVPGNPMILFAQPKLQAKQMII